VSRWSGVAVLCLRLRCCRGWLGHAVAPEPQNPTARAYPLVNTANLELAAEQPPRLTLAAFGGHSILGEPAGSRRLNHAVPGGYRLVLNRLVV